MDGSPMQESDRRQSRLVSSLLVQLNEKYIFPEVAGEMEQSIRMRLSSGEYDTVDSDKGFAAVMTQHLQEVSHDKHLRVFYHSTPVAQAEDETEGKKWPDWYPQWAMQHNFGFHRVERLPGNIGYLDLRSFDAPEVGAAETAVAALNFLANTHALIIDLRQNIGGWPEMVAFVTSYLFDEIVHLNDMYSRESDSIQQFWTLPYVPGTRYGGKKPVYVLTSSATVSGGEEFTYNLKNLKRATIVGETTSGAAHPGDIFHLDEHFEVFIPTGRPINPVSGTNWEGTGVIPDISVPANDAFNAAHVLALKHVIEVIGDASAEPSKELLKEAQTTLAELEP